MIQSVLRPYPTVEDTERHPYTPRERTIADVPEQVRDRLTAFAAEHDAGALVILTITEDATSRLRSHDLLAEAFALRRGTER
jgi:alkanesulfonate monooxygenase SsuD/methylene tetrahydromethanopterin reductase-like flavin-dependent oxidoreductase (luciferase family)